MSNSEDASASNLETIKTRIWREEAVADNPFVTQSAFLRGFNVYQDLLGKISFFEYLFLLFFDEPAKPEQVELLEQLAVALANPGPRDLSVRASMTANVGGAVQSACMMASLGAGAGVFGGARELYYLCGLWAECEFDWSAWQSKLADFKVEAPGNVWPDSNHILGLNPLSSNEPTWVHQVLLTLADQFAGSRLAWLKAHTQPMETTFGGVLNITAVAAAVLTDLGFDAEQSELLYLWLRLPGAMAHGYEQRELGFKSYPFWHDGIDLLDEHGLEQENTSADQDNSGKSVKKAKKAKTAKKAKKEELAGVGHE